MEEQLKELLTASAGPNRARWALEWSKRGGKVIGLLCSYVPEEIVIAAGMMPYHVMGTERSDMSRALAHRHSNSSIYCNRVLESFLSGELDFLDGVIATDREQELVRTWDVLAYLNKTAFSHIMHVPSTVSALGLQKMTLEMTNLKKAVEKFGGKPITDASLLAAIKTVNKTRSLLASVYELRKRETPSVSGAEAMLIVAAAMVMPKDVFNTKLEALIPYLSERKAKTGNGHIRLLISSDTLYNPAYIQLVEQAGAVVAMDDLDPGSRYFTGAVSTRSRDKIGALAKRYLTRPAHPCMCDWDSQARQVIAWVKEYRIDGVVELPEMYALPRQFRVPIFQKRLNEAGVPNISVARFHDMSDASQLKTRIEAFVELLEAKA